MFSRELAERMRNGEIGVLPTDTIYGLVGSALLPETVECIYRVRKRESTKPMIILISDIAGLEHFHIKLAPKDRKVLEKIWPDKVSVVLTCPEDKFSYLHRGTQTLAFRVPKDKALREFLKVSGPLVAPSANPAGEKPAETIEEAKNFFGGQVDFYVDAGRKTSDPSTVVTFTEGHQRVLRSGAVPIS